MMFCVNLFDILWEEGEIRCKKSWEVSLVKRWDKHVRKMNTKIISCFEEELMKT